MSDVFFEEVSKAYLILKQKFDDVQVALMSGNVKRTVSVLTSSLLLENG